MTAEKTTSAQKLILAIDQGTTSTRAILFDRDMRSLAVAQREFPQIYPRPGWVEHNADALWTSLCNVVSEVTRNPGGAEAVAAMALTNQRETVVVWNRHTGIPVYNAIVWQCRRTADFCTELKRDGAEPLIRDKTGLILDAYFSASKIRWILDNVAGAREAAGRGDLLCGTVDTWLIWKLTGGTAHVTDFTNASRTLLFDIHNLRWDDDLLALFGVPRSMLPEVVASSGMVAQCRLPGAGAHEVPLMGLAGDQQAALFGQGCLKPGEVKNTYGTGCFLMMNTGGQAVRSKHGLLTTLTAQTTPSAPQYALEGSIFMGGAVMRWLRDELQILPRPSDAGIIAAGIPGTGGVYLVPAFAGMGAPHWDMRARGTLVGMTQGTGRHQIIRAAEEAIAYQCCDLAEAMRRDTGHPLTSMRVDGGAAADDFLMQFQADMLNCRIDRPVCRESTAAGAAALAAQALGWRGRDALAAQEPERSFRPAMDAAQRASLLAGWRKAVARAAEWVD